jgi:hypothetical protein
VIGVHTDELATAQYEGIQLETRFIVQTVHQLNQFAIKLSDTALLSTF